MTLRVSQSTSRLYSLTNVTTSSFSTASTDFLRHTIPIVHSTEIPCTHKAPFTQISRYSTGSKLFPEAMEAVKQTVAQNMGVSGAHTLVPEDQQFDLKDTPDLSGKVAIITGGSEGIGYAAAHTLLSHNIAKLFILSVSKDVIDGSIETIKQELGEEAANKITWLECDLSDWKKTKETADKIAKSTDRIDILMNNAARGIMTYQLTDYGVDRHVRTTFPLPLPLPQNHQ